MEFLRQLLAEHADLVSLTEAKKRKKVPKIVAQSVYHRDYVKTRNKPYRQYSNEDRTDNK